MPKPRHGTTMARGVGARAVSTQDKSTAREASGLHKRSRSGCFICRLRRKKCDEARPDCKTCINLGLKCEYMRPKWWSTPEGRLRQKEQFKEVIRDHKSSDRHISLHGQANRGLSQKSPPLPGGYDFNCTVFTKSYDPTSSQTHPSALPAGSYSAQYAPWEIDVRTESQTFVNNVPFRHDSSVSTFSAMGPPQLHTTLPAFHADDWLQEECFNQSDPVENLDPSLIQQCTGPPLSYLHTSTVPVEEYDKPLLDHFVDNVLRMIFPILEIHQRGTARAKAILDSLETNKSYLHCCLSVSAIHLKTSVALSADHIDHDIMRHRYEAISQLCQALNRDTEHNQILDATLAMIFFHCSVGAPDDSLPDIPWSDHFQAVSNLVSRLEHPLMALSDDDTGPQAVTAFSMTLTSWIDILGSTMLGKSPQFAHAYRDKHLIGTSSGLKELMGCDDRIMYLISEIACLDSLKAEGRIDEMAVCHHVSALGAQLEHTELADPSLQHPYSPDGAIRPDCLTKTMSSIFRIAARIYLCSLVPGFDRLQMSNTNLISALTHALQYIPAGPYGFDRSIVWPLLMAGAFSTSNCVFRSVLAERAAALGDTGDLGSFGRMYRLLQEVWRLSDDPMPGASDHEVYSSHESSVKQEISLSPEQGGVGMRSIRKQSVHWRDVMHRNSWRYLLM